MDFLTAIIDPLFFSVLAFAIVALGGIFTATYFMNKAADSSER